VLVAGVGLLQGMVQVAHVLARMPTGLEGLVEGPLAELAPDLQIISTANAASSVLWQPVSWLMLSGIYFIIAYVLGGRGRITGLMATLGFAQVPALLAIPFSALPLLSVVSGGLGLLGSLVSALAGLVALLWGTVLSIIGVRESLALSTGRATLTVLLPVLVVLALVALVLCVVLAFILAAAGAFSPS